jgi:hypothetical protein
MHSARRLAFSLTLLFLLVWLAIPITGRAQSKPAPLTISLEPFGLPKGLFAEGHLLTCFYEHAAGTRMFWLDASHIFVAFTTNPPCTRKDTFEPARLRGIVFDSTGAKIASRDWPLEGNLTLFAGPNHSIILWHGSRLQFLDSHFETIESGELAEKPKSLWVTPAHRTIPLLSADGRNFEFYSADPLRLLTTIELDQSTEANAVLDWIPGDERVAGSRCKDSKSAFTCTKIIVLTPDANFLAPDGAPWSYEETEKPISLHPVGFLDSAHLLISREDKNFFHSAQLLIVKPDGARMLLPNPGSSFSPSRIAGVAAGGSRFALELLAQGPCEDCIAAKRFVVAELDSKKFLFQKNGSPYFSHAELSPDGKWIAILDNSALTLYPLPALE